MGFYSYSGRAQLAPTEKLGEESVSVLSVQSLHIHSKNWVIWFSDELLKLLQLATKCHILRLKCATSFVGWGSAQTSLWERCCTLPQTLELDFTGPTSKERKGRREEGRGGKKMGGQGDCARAPWWDRSHCFDLKCQWCIGCYVIKLCTKF